MPSNKSTTGLNTMGKVSLLWSPVLSGYTSIGILPVLPQIQAHYSDVPNSATIVRLLITIIGVAMVFGAPIAGFCANRFGWRRMLLGGSIAYGLIGVAGAFVDSLWLLLLTRLLLGLATAVVGTLMMTIATTAMAGDERNKWLGYVMVAGMVSSLILIPLSGILGSVSWRVPFLVYGMGFVMAVLVAVGVPDQETDTSDTSGLEGAGPETRAGFPFIIIGVALTTGILCGAQSVYLPFHIANLGVRDPTTVSLSMLPGAAIGALFSMLYGRIRRKLSIPATFMLAFAAAGMGQSVIGTAGGVTGVIIGGIISGMGIGLMTPNLYAFTAVIGTTAERARNMGLTRGGFFAGPLLAQAALEPIAAIAKAGGAILALGALGIVSALVFSRLKSEKVAIET